MVNIQYAVIPRTYAVAVTIKLLIRSQNLTKNIGVATEDTDQT